MNDFEPTHRIIITRPGREPEVRLVRLCEDAEGEGGLACTAQEWEDASAADIERDEDGAWLWQGQPIGALAGDGGTVEVASVWEHGALCDYATGATLRPATAEERAESDAQVTAGRAEGTILVGDRTCYVEPL